FMAPSNLSCLIVNGLERAFAPNSIVRACPAVSTVGGFGEVNGITGVSGDNKQSCLGIKTGRPIVGETGFVGSNDAPIWSRLFIRIGNRATLRVDAEGPVHRSIGQG